MLCLPAGTECIVAPCSGEVSDVPFAIFDEIDVSIRAYRSTGLEKHTPKSSLLIHSEHGRSPQYSCTECFGMFRIASQVFMDEVNRRVMLKTVVKVAKDWKENRQYCILTPHNLSTIKKDDNTQVPLFLLVFFIIVCVHNHGSATNLPSLCHMHFNPYHAHADPQDARAGAHRRRRPLASDGRDQQTSRCQHLPAPAPPSAPSRSRPSAGRPVHRQCIADITHYGYLTRCPPSHSQCCVC